MNGRICGAVVAPPDFVVVSSPDRVDAWSVRRLPFEPKGSMLLLRDALREAILGLADDASGSLRAVYASPSTDFCDAENVLLYNVGPARFARLATRRLTFERSSRVPPCPAQLSGPPLHHHTYFTDDESDFLHWSVDSVVASGSARFPLRAEKPADWWWHARTGLRTEAAGLAPGLPFALRLRILDRSTSIPAILKPLLDGVIAALQSDGSPSDEAVVRLADHLRVETGIVRAHLTTPGALHGHAPLVRPYRSGLQWNPVDDLCTACAIERVDDGAAREVHWELLAVSAHTGSSSRVLSGDEYGGARSSN